MYIYIYRYYTSITRSKVLYIDGFCRIDLGYSMHAPLITAFRLRISRTFTFNASATYRKILHDKRWTRFFYPLISSSSCHVHLVRFFFFVLSPVYITLQKSFENFEKFSSIQKDNNDWTFKLNTMQNLC